MSLWVSYAVGIIGAIVGLAGYFRARKVDKFERYKLQRDVLLTRLNELQGILETLEDVKKTLIGKHHSNTELDKFYKLLVRPIQLKLRRYGLNVSSEKDNSASYSENIDNEKFIYATTLKIDMLTRVCLIGIDRDNMQLYKTENRILGKSNKWGNHISINLTN